jgi:precorrin-6Y C5,15-methyltransferase (decarboxylating)
MRTRSGPIQVVGLGLGPEDLTPRGRALIERADILVGGRRQLAHFEDLPAEKKPIRGDLEEVIDFIRRRRRSRRSIVVLASGDPLFFGIAARLIEAFGPQAVAVHPNVSSLAAAFARIKEPWGGVRIASLHGRGDEAGLFDLLQAEERLAVLTDPQHGPAWLARRMLSAGMTGFRMCVLEALGEKGERVAWLELEQAAAGSFGEPNLVVLKRRPPDRSARGTLRLGMPEAFFAHEKGLITKSEVRAVALSKLELETGHVLWDLGAGSGSLAVEAALFIKRGRILAVERDPARCGHIRANSRRFGVRNLSVVLAELPAGIRRLPRPDRVFIGGGGSRLAAIIAAAAGRLRPGGILVVNTVLLASVAEALAALRQAGLNAQSVQIQVSRSRSMPWGERLEALNPVWIVWGTKGVR